MHELFLCAAVAGVALLWRNFRYDRDLSINARIDALPYLIRKPITCGLCVTFWIAGATTLVFHPFAALVASLPYRHQTLEPLRLPLEFGAQWMALGVGAVAIVYVIDTFFQISHVLKHRSHG
jgi:hypothetical protein